MQHEVNHYNVKYCIFESIVGLDLNTFPDMKNNKKKLQNKFKKLQMY